MFCFLLLCVGLNLPHTSKNAPTPHKIEEDVFSSLLGLKPTGTVSTFSLKMQKVSSLSCHGLRANRRLASYPRRFERNFSFGLPYDEVHRLHSGYRHPVIRQWQGQAECQITPSQLMYPVFVADNIEGSQEVPVSIP